jgi:hypothetical protein
MTPIGRKIWAIVEDYIPSWSNDPEPLFTSHETACLLNASEDEAHVEITIFFSDRDPGGPYRITVPARRTSHVRFNNLHDPESIPHDADYSSVITPTYQLSFSTRGWIRSWLRTPC